MVSYQIIIGLGDFPLSTNIVNGDIMPSLLGIGPGMHCKSL